MAQMSMCANIEKNLDKTMYYIKSAAENKADLIFFPEIQLSHFFLSTKTAVQIHILLQKILKK